MPDKQGSHENVRPDQSRDAFEAALAALRPRVDCSQSKTKFIPTGPGSTAASPVCVHPDGHEFICIHCGGAVPPPARSRRWAWLAALGATASAAAVLLAIVISDRSSRVAVQESKPPAVANKNPSLMTESVQRPCQEAVAIALRSIADRSTFRRNFGRVPSAADLELSDDLFAAEIAPMSAAANHESAGMRTSSPATLRALLSQFGVVDQSTN
jgi:hypothetical protein